MTIPYTITDLTATVYLDGEPFTVDRTTNTFKRLVEALNISHPALQESEVRRALASYAVEMETVKHENKGRVTVTRRGVTYNGSPVNDSLTRRILDISAAGLPVDPWIAFTENLYSNPAPHAREEMYDWLEKADLPITDDGCFLAYKRVTKEFKDLHTRTFDNSPGKVVTMPGGRPAVDPIRDNHCSTGLHFCSKDYLPHFGSDYGDTVVLLKINPADVVSIPSDYDNTKGRTWRYEVLSVVEDYATKEWAPVVADNGGEWYRKDPFGNLIQADPYSIDESGDLVWDEGDTVCSTGIYPYDCPRYKGGMPVVYPDRIGDAIVIYSDGGYDFQDEV